MYTRLDCVGRPPQFEVEFYPYADLTHSIRLRHGVAYVRLSDLLRGAARQILEATAAILLARLYRKRAPSEMMEAYQKYSYASATRRRLLELRKKRARRRLALAQGKHHDLGRMYDKINRQYFGEELRRPKLGWSTRTWRSQLGAFDPALGQIAINCGLDRADVPEYVIAYVVYHEMLHQKHPMKFARCRLESHSRKFREDEKVFEDYNKAMKFLERFA